MDQIVRPVNTLQKTQILPQSSPAERQSIPPWLFRHENVMDAIENAKPVNKKTLVNAINHIHFMDGNLLVHLRHLKYHDTILLGAHPEPCLDGEVRCRWSDKTTLDLHLEDYEFLHLVIVDGKSMIFLPAVPKETGQSVFTVHLPHLGYAVGSREARRYTCKGISAEISQNGFLAKGQLLDFSPIGFRIRVRPYAKTSFYWFNLDAPVFLYLRRSQQVYFAGLCQCLRHKNHSAGKEIVLRASSEKTRRFASVQIRNPRQHLVPPPTLIFFHPLLNKRVRLDVSDISTSGFSAYEKEEEGVLVQGMIIPELTIEFGGAVRMKCAAQVIYRSDEKEKGFRCGLAIMDMGISDYTRLTHIISSAIDPHAHITNDVDLDALWEFFFDAGFIYPQKYRLVQSNRKAFKDTYKKLFNDSQEIGWHFTYQENGRIYGHVSMVRAYEKTWMVQHHTARTMENKWSGFMVLKHILHYLNGMFRFPSTNADYIMCYFRPENKLPDRAFGGFARSLGNPKGCSIDLFSYLPYATLSIGARLPRSWSLQECSSLDLWELNRFYNHYSGGLLLKMMRLTDRDSSNESIESIYDKSGFLRKWKAYSLKSDGKLSAVIIVEQSDVGLNLSELLNGIKILVTNPTGLPWDTLSTAIGQFVSVFKTDKVPVLIYPQEYVSEKGIPFEKRYQLWIHEATFMDRFLEYLESRCRIRYWK